MQSYSKRQLFHKSKLQSFQLVKDWDLKTKDYTPFKSGKENKLFQPVHVLSSLYFSVKLLAGRYI